jgi:predicted metalloprotease with PDZ domain
MITYCRRFSLVLISIVVFSLHSYGIHTSLLPPTINYSFVVSVENPNRHYIHVEMTCINQSNDFIDFKMPVWTPGYYGIQNNSKHLTGFKAVNGHGEPLTFTKTLKNTWRVNTKNEPVVVVSYEVYADRLSVVTSYLDASQAFISPTSIFLFPDGEIQQPSLVTLKPYKEWKSISTGLDKIEGKPNTYFAPNFDVLFDCPILMGNQQELQFTVKGIPHILAVSEKDTLDKTRFISDLKKIIDAATYLMGDIPYKHYTFITIGSAGGGLEHSNSTVLSCRNSVADTTNMVKYKRWLSFVAHEYFHLYNVKSIRPIALGPFDYDRECYTNLLWFSEGATVYYENILLNRAGILSRDECLNNITESIVEFENRPGRLMESATESSFDAWIHFFERNAENRNNTISYYDKGCALSLLLDLKIRDETKNQKSLDDVMRLLYYKYYKELERGFTDEEFREVCETIAGTSLSEIFTYAGNVVAIDYPKYLAIPGLTIDTCAQLVVGRAYFGASLRSDEEKCWLKGVERNSPAWNAGLGNDIEVLTIDGQKACNEVFESVMETKKAGDMLRLSISVGDKPAEIEVELAPKMEKSFKIEEMEFVSDLQNEIKELWLK